MAKKLVRPLQALRLANDIDMIYAAFGGDKKITIREGHRDYQPGVAILCIMESSTYAEIDITSVQHTTLDNVTIEDLRADGFVDNNQAFEGLRLFYPDLKPDSPVTVIRWDNIRGRAVDDFPYNM